MKFINTIYRMNFYKNVKIDKFKFLKLYRENRCIKNSEQQKATV